jgi:hypothetical protein
VRAGLAATVLALALAVAAPGCGTCRPNEPAVRPEVGGAIGGGSGGYWHSTSVGLDLSNLFCRQPPPPPPRPEGTPPIGTKPEDAASSGTPPSDAGPAR